MGGPNLLRSDVMLNDRAGELRPVVRGSRADRHAANRPARRGYHGGRGVHPQRARHRSRAGRATEGEPVTLNVLVGDAAAGQAYFAAKCSTCHSPTGDLRGIGTRVPDAMRLQNLWVGGGGRRT